MPNEVVQIHITEDDFLALGDEYTDSLIGSCVGDDEGLEYTFIVPDEGNTQ